MNKFSKICIIDDDELVHELWRKVFKYKNIDVIDMYDYPKEKELMRMRANKDSLYLIDLDLRDIKNGLDLIEEIGGQKNSILVTGHSISGSVENRAKLLSVKILQKQFIDLIEVN